VIEPTSSSACTDVGQTEPTLDRACAVEQRNGGKDDDGDDGDDGVSYRTCDARRDDVGRI